MIEIDGKKIEIGRGTVTIMNHVQLVKKAENQPGIQKVMYRSSSESAGKVSPGDQIEKTCSGKDNAC